MIKKITFFSSDFKILFVWHLTGKILRFEFYPKIVFFECKFRILRSAITLIQDWPIGLQRVGSRIKWCQRLTSLKLQRVNAAYCTCKTRGLNFIQRLFFLSASLGFYGPPLLLFKTDRLFGLQRVGSRIKWCQRLTSLKLQRVNAAYCTCKTRV